MTVEATFFPVKARLMAIEVAYMSVEAMDHLEHSTHVTKICNVKYVCIPRCVPHGPEDKITFSEQTSRYIIYSMCYINTL